MAVRFYNRYAPRASSKVDDSNEPVRAQKRRRLDIRGTLVNGQTELDSKGWNTSKTKIERAKRERPPVKEFESNTDAIALEHSRHEKVRRKLEKASVARLEPENASNEVESVPTAASPYNSRVGNNSEPKKHGLEPLPQPAPPDEPAGPALDALPEWIRQPTRIPSGQSSQFAELLSSQMSNHLANHGYTQATAIQTGLLPWLLPGKDQYDGDICVASSTGTGKTLAFIAPMVEALKGRPVTRLRGLVIVPTREIVSQTLAVATICAMRSGLRIETTKGNKDISEERKLLIRKTTRYDPSQWERLCGASFDVIDYESSNDEASDAEFEALRDIQGMVPRFESKADILICTPGRLVEHMRTTPGFTLDDIEWLIVDEMDRLLDSSFVGWTDVVIPCLKHDSGVLTEEDAIWAGISYIPRTRRVRKVLASATITSDADKLASLQLYRPLLVTLEDKSSSADSQNQEARFQIPNDLAEATVIARDADKPLVLLLILQNLTRGNISKEANTSVRASRTSIESSETTSSSSSSTGESSDSESDTENLQALSSARSNSSSESDSTSSSGSSSVSDSQADDFTSSSGSSNSSTSTSNSSEDSSDEDTSSRTGKTSSPTPHPDSTPSRSSPPPMLSKLQTGSPRILIFTSRNENAMRLARLLSLMDPSLRVAAFTGSSRQSDRRKALQSFLRGALHILIASNLASRSLNLHGLTHVINYDMPTSIEMYVHRVGRAARAGRAGVALTLLTRREVRWFQNEIERSPTLQRQTLVQRQEAPHIVDEQRAQYEEMLQALGQETRSQ